MTLGRHAGIEIAGWPIPDATVIKGLRWLRYNALWQDGWGTAGFERAREHARIAGSRLLVVLMSREKMSNPFKRMAYADWCVETIKAHPDVREWEIGNEPDIRRPPTPEEPYGFDGDAGLYAITLQSIYGRLKGQTDARIWLGGQAYLNGGTWLDRFQQIVDGTPFDVGSFHSYVYAGQSWNKPWQRLAELEARFGGTKPFVVTETQLICPGQPGTCPPYDPPQKSHPFHQEQARYVAHTVEQARRHNRSVIFYLDGPHWWKGVGSHFVDWTPKPWRTTLRQLVAA